MTLSLGIGLNPGSTLGPVTTLESLVTGITGFEALFNADVGITQSGNVISSFAAQEGVGLFDQPDATKRPLSLTRDGKRILDFRGSESMGLQNLTIGAAPNYTIGLRYYQKEIATLPQTICGYSLPPDTYRLVHLNNTVNDATLRLDSAEADSNLDQPDTVGWRTVIITQGGGVGGVSVNGAPRVTAAISATALPQFVLAGLRNDVVSQNAHINLRSLVLIRSDVSQDAIALNNLKSYLDAS